MRIPTTAYARAGDGMTNDIGSGVTIVSSITRPDGETCFIEAPTPFAMICGSHSATAHISARTLSFRWTPGEFNFPFHLAPRRRLVIVMEGGLEAETSDGEIRVFQPGDIWEIRDTSGKGHCSRAYQGKPFRTAFLTLDDDVKFDRRAQLDGVPARQLPCWNARRGGEHGRDLEISSLAYVMGGIEGLVTREYPVCSFQFVASRAEDWFIPSHDPAPHIEFVLTGSYCERQSGGDATTVVRGDIVLGTTGDIRAGPRKITGTHGGSFLSVFAYPDAIGSQQ